MLLGFRETGGARWDCRLDFDRFDYANLSFFDATGTDILFHLSFRPTDQMVAFNRRFADVWETEQNLPCTLAPEGNAVQIDFADDTIRVLLNDSEILTHTRGADDAAIEQFDIHGGAFDVRIDGPANQDRPGAGELSLISPFLLAGWGFELGAQAQDLVITIDGLATTIPVARLPRPDLAAAAGLNDANLGVTAVLPGRIWRGQDSDSALRLQLVSNGRPCGAPLTIDRAALIEMIETVASTEDARDAFAMVSAVEHVACAGLIPELSHAARRRLSLAIDIYKLNDLLNPEDLVLDGDAETGIATSVDPDIAAVEAVQKAFARSMRGGDRLSPAEALEGVAPEIADLTSNQKRLLVMRLVEVCAEADQVAALQPLAKTCGLLDSPASDAPWERSFRLPFEMLVEDSDAVLEFFQWLAQRPEGWVSTPAICWSLDRIVRDCPLFLSDSARESIARAFLDYVDWHAWNYWGRTSCTFMTRSVVGLLEHVHLFSQWFGDWAVDRALRSHWLAPSFWAGIDAGAPDAPYRSDPRLVSARAAFDAVVAVVESGADTHALEALPPPTAIEGDRVMREMLAVGWSGDRLATLEMHRRNDLAVRRHALPGGTADGAIEAPQVARAIRALSPMLPRSEYLELQTMASQAATDLLAALGTAEETDLLPDLRALHPQLRVLGGRRAGFVGVATALNLANGLLRAGVADLAQAAVEMIQDLVAAVPDIDRAELPIAPAVRMAVFGLRQTAQTDPTGRAWTLVRLLSEAEAAIPPAADPAAETLLARDARAMFFDTVVVIFSCKPLLETRVKQQRETWLKDLQALGVPYLIVVGDGDNTVRGDILHIDAPDSYEGLPAKVLATIRWVYRNTPFSHILKIDDDCFLDVDRFFHSQSYRKFAYYGRRLHRTEGQTDRTWHLTRANTDLAELDIDKSPEPSTYAEGGSGYVLNRAIMDLLIRNAETPEGARLVLTSIMEDKLIGDLLGLSGVLPDSEDYDACVLRRSHSKGTPVSRWENAFLPSRVSPAKMVHLDTPDLQTWAAQVHDSAELWPKKVWPTYAPARMGWNTNAVDLVSSPEHLVRINAEPLVVICCIRNELTMLPMFLEHYRTLGVKGFFCVDNCSDDGTLEFLMEQPDVVTFSADTDYWASVYGVAWQQALMANFRLNRWSLIADADEFLALRDDEHNLPDLLETPEFRDADAARVFMLDLYPKGHLSQADLSAADPFSVADHVDREPFLAESTATGPFCNAETWTSSLRHRLLPGSRSELFVAQKYALLRYRPWMHLSAGLHYLSEGRVATRDMIFAHFKYHAAFHAKVAEETRRRQHFNDAEEYRRYLALISEGRDVMFEEDVSVPWRNCDWVRERLG